MELCIDLYGTPKLGMDPCFCFVNGLPQTFGLLGFHPNQRCIESRVGKTPYGTRWL